MPRYATAPPAKRTYVRKTTAPPKRTYVRKAAPARSTYVRKAAPARKTYARRSGGSSLGTSIGTAIGAALGGPAGAGIGGMVGNAGGSLLSSIFGHGDYKVSNVGAIKENNIALSNSAQIPQFGSGKVACKFVHREFLGDIYSSITPSTFKIESYPLNPGLNRTFPWLSGVVGAKFQQYRLNGLTFEFRSMSGDALNSTNTALGSVIMSTDYDSADSVFATKQEMENTEYGVSCKPSCNMMHAIECARAQTPVNELYIRAFDVPAGKDVRLYDMGRFSIASTGCQGSNVNLGELWVSYDIDCFKAIEQAPYYLTPVSSFTLNSVDATNPFGLTRTPIIDQIGMTFTYDSVTGHHFLVFPTNLEIGTTLSIYYSVNGDSTPGVAHFGGIPFNNLIAVGSSSDIPHPANATSNQRQYAVTVRIGQNGQNPANPPTIQFTGGVVPANITTSFITIAVVSPNYPINGV